MAEIRICGLTHRYPGALQDTLNGLDLDIGSGEAHALLGGSGAGKTTLLNLLSGLLMPDAGEIRFAGRDVSRVPPRDRGVAQVFQFPVLYESLRVAELLALPLRNRGWRLREAASRVTEIAERLQLETLLDCRVSALSLFHRQLVGIARALVRPDIAVVLLDEPLTAVQPATKWELRQVLLEVQRELGATMIYVTHDQTEALTFADRVSVMHDGRILQTDTPQALYERPAHEHVAHFIGTPGMNLLRGEARDGALWLGGVPVAKTDGSMAPGPCTIGFRPEWAVLDADEIGDAGDGVRCAVTAARVLGVDVHRPVGLIHALLGEQPFCTRQVVDLVAGAAARLRLDPQRLLVFRDGVEVSTRAPR
jgi:glycerol transport system ATP-binding protein